MKEIKLTKGKVALIDDEDFELISSHKWHVSMTGYPMRQTSKPKRRNILMHHEIVGKPPVGLVTDHINRDKLDNRRSNLRFCTQEINARNMAHTIIARGGSRGVSFSKRMKRWHVKRTLTIDDKRKVIFLGTYADKETAMLVNAIAVRVIDSIMPR